jgi:hypothetical protein
MSDERAITDALHRYCRAMDRMDEPLARSIWHAGGTADYSPMFTGTGDEFVVWVWQAHASFAAHSHQITTVLVEVDRDRAVSEAYVTAVLQTPPVDGRVHEITARGRYLDRWSRRDRRWAIDHRRFVTDLQSSVEVDAMPPGDGRRDRTDPSYELFPGR